VTNTNITVDLNGVTDTSNDSLLLINSTKGCIFGTPVIFYVNIPACTILKNQNTSSSLSVLFTREQNCGGFMLATWEIVVIIAGSILILAVIFVIIVFAIPSIRKKIFPHGKDAIKEKKEVKLENDMNKPN